MSSGFGNSGWGQGGYGAPSITSLTPGYYTTYCTTSEYANSARWQALIKALIQPLADIGQCLASFITGFDVDYAVGPQLDILGSIAGVGRVVPFQPTGGISPVLDDATYRVLIKATVAQNQWDGTQDGLQGTWQFLFPGATIAILDHQDMSALVIIPQTGAYTPIIQQLILNNLIVPRPQGVLYRYTFASKPIFGLDQNNANVAGVDSGNLS